MAVCAPCEDICSLMLTAVAEFFERFPSVRKCDIGRLEVGTETLVDKAKSLKSVLMQLFSREEGARTDMEGVDNINACYGGTAALFNTVAWMQSDFWDGRLGLVVMGDIAVYAPGPARPTGGAGVVVLLVAPDAPLAVDVVSRGSHAEHAWDFYKPHLASEYPEVAGKHSVDCYLRALRHCWTNMQERRRVRGRLAPLRLADVDYVAFHVPYVGITNKAAETLLACDRELGAHGHAGSAGAAWVQTTVRPSTTLSAQLGNLYTGSLYLALASLLLAGIDLDGKTVLMYSYGSGLCSSMFVLRGRASTSDVLDATFVRARLAQRTPLTCKHFNELVDAREAAGPVPYPEFATQHDAAVTLPLYDRPYVLMSIDEHGKREYARLPPGQAATPLRASL